MNTHTRKFLTALTILAVLPLLLLPATAQEEKASSNDTPAFYRVSIRVIEKIEGKATNSRDYLLYLKHDVYGEIRTGNKVPIPSDKGTVYMDVGLNVDCMVRRIGGNQVAVDLRFELASVAGQRSVLPGQSAPITRSVQSTASTKIELGKPTTIISVNDVTSESRFELEITIEEVD